MRSVTDRWREAYINLIQGYDDEALKSAAKAQKVKGWNKMGREKLIASLIEVADQTTFAISRKHNG